MTSFQGRFRLDCPRSSAPSPSDSSIVPSTAPNSPAFAYIEFRAHPDPTPPKPTRGCFEHDSASSKFGLRWERWTDFQAWLITEQETHCIELRLVNTYPSTPAFQRACRYVCSRKGTGGIKPYTKLHPEWNRKRGTKRTGCKCTLLVKEYPGVDTILGSYADQHNHPLGNANLPFTRIPKRSREYIAGENDTVLPSSQHIMPNAEESRCHETIPRVKTRTRGAGDPSYGGNANSGSEAKQPKPAKSNPRPTVETSSSTDIVPLAAQLPAQLQPVPQLNPTPFPYPISSYYFPTSLVPMIMMYPGAGGGPTYYWCYPLPNPAISHT